MIVLHGSYSIENADRGLIFLWAEHRTRNTPNQSPDHSAIRPVNAASLRDIGNRLVPQMDSPFLTMDRQTLYVPAPPHSTGETDLAPMDTDVQWWSHTRLQRLREHVYSVDAVNTVVYEGTRVALHIGASLRFWLTFMDWIDLLVAREQIVPTVKQETNVVPNTYAAWRPVSTEEVHDDLHTFRRAMPLACCTPLLRPLDGHGQTDGTEAATVEAAIDTALNHFLETYLSAVLQETLRYMSPAAPGPGSRIVIRYVDSLFGGREPMENIMTEPSVSKLVDAVQEWSFDLYKNKAASPPPPAAMSAKPYVVLRLSPAPDGDAAPDDNHVWEVARDWTVEFWVKEGDDAPYPLARLWETDDAAAGAKRVFCVRRLAWLSRDEPGLGPALRQLPPAGVTVDLGDLAHLFDSGVQQWLEDNYVLVEIPHQFDPAAKPNIQLTITPASDEVFSLGSLVNFEWRATIGNVEIDEDTFRAMVAEHTSYLRFGDRWIRLDAAAFEALNRIWGDGAAQGAASLADVTSAVDDLQQEAGAVVRWHTPPEADSAAFRRLRDVFTGHVTWDEVKPPERLRATLRPYQARGAAWLAMMAEMNLGVCLADDMGLGKTVQVIAYLLQQKEDGLLTGPCIVIAPMAVVENWHREIVRFAPDLSSIVHHGPDRLDGGDLIQLLAITDAPDVVITSYGTAQRDADMLQHVRWHTVVADEAQNIKNPQAKNTRTLKSLSARHRIALTGTPIENNLEELWSIMDFLNPGYLGSVEYFRRAFALPVERHGDSAKARRLRHMVRPFLLRRTKEDNAIAPELPGKQEAKLYCDLTPKQASLYQGVVDKMMDQIRHADGMRRRGLVFSALTQLKQICNHPALVLKQPTANPAHSGKMMHLLERLKHGVAADAKALVFTQYTHMGLILQQTIRSQLNTDAAFYHGGLSRLARESMIDAFQSEGGPRILVLSLRAGGVGINLTRATHVFHYDRWWNPAVESQATDRAYRIGQTTEVQVHTLICRGTLEDHIDAIIEKKRSLADHIIESGERWITELTTDELADIFSLRNEAISV